MKSEDVTLAGLSFPLHSLNTLVIGSGAAGLNAASALYDLGQRDVAIATEAFGGGTSANAGSDKQTYYKLSLAGDEPDSPFAMARDLWSGGSMHGDIALCEAQGSPRAFFRLVGLGVPFPHDAYGAFVGYKTDHDPRQRATSAGPLTSRLMVEALARDVRRKRIRIFDRHQIIGLLTKGSDDSRSVVGAVALDLDRLKARNQGFVLFNAVNVVLATGGPAGIYAASVYPESQTGSHGLAFAAGAAAHNLTESQYGLASTKFRWNLSGTYQQVVPRYLSTGLAGRDEREFLNDVFPDMGRLATAIFLKGYQWPFDPRKIAGYGSSLIDLLVYHETAVKGRRVFLDYRRNPSGAGKLVDFDFGLLAPEASAYLEKSGALLPTPIERLRRMNGPAIELYKDHGIDLAKEPLEIAVCAQHNNGGFKGNIWWESNIRHLFPVGEVNGTHGVYRPGGSALNSGQVGSFRAATYIARSYGKKPGSARAFVAEAGRQVQALWQIATDIASRKPGRGLDPGRAGREIGRRMSSFGAHIRDPRALPEEIRSAWKLYADLRNRAGGGGLPASFRAIDLALTHAVYLEACREYIDKGGRSRGSSLVLDPAGDPPCPELGAAWRFALAKPEDFVSRHVLEVRLGDAGRPVFSWAGIRPIPAADRWFENVWNDFRQGRTFEENP
jgi:succinate dehydrogenase/fumarate reductase flavoprotein subunit